MPGSAAVLAGAWALTILWGAWRVRRLPARVPVPGASRAGRFPAPSDTTRRVVSLAAALAVGLLVSPPLGLGVGLVAWARPRLVVRRAEAERTRQVVDGLPEVIDILRLGLSAGHSVLQAIRLVGHAGPEPVGRSFALAAARVDRGALVADAIDDIGELGEPVRPLVSALIASSRYGLPLQPTLDELARQARHDRRRRTEAAARKASVTLLFPLVLCVLPAFALLTVVPTLAGSIGRLG